MYFKIAQNWGMMLRYPNFFYHFVMINPIKIALVKYFNYRKQKGTILGKKILSAEEANKDIYLGLIGNEPFLSARGGMNELVQVAINEMIINGIRRNFDETIMNTGKTHAGIFPIEQNIFIRFAEEYAQSLAEVDLLVYWGSVLMEEYIIKRYAMGAKLMPSRPLEPFGHKEPWTRALSNKKVLIVHPFEKTIRSQYERRKLIFSNPDILPDFNLITMRSIQSAADSTCAFRDWFEALDYMYSEIEKIEFDIALLGCGAYGLPLAARIKRSRRKAIHLGGMTQLLFGIKGARWEATRPDIVALYNDAWVRASEDEKPKGAKKIENGAYW